MSEFNNLIEEANKVYLRNFKPETWFEKCVFLSWYCDVGDCKFCFRSTLKGKIKNARDARRSFSSVLTEVYLCKALGWKLEFLTGGYRIFPFDELVNIVRTVSKLYGEKIWINLGALSQDELEILRPYVRGICGSIETVNRELHDKICPSKPIEPYLEMFEEAKGFEKSVAIVIGLGEEERDMEKLCDLIKEYNLTKVDFYPLHLIKGTPFKKTPDKEYYAKWVANTRIEFPKLKITAGTWVDRVEEVGLILKAGANSITKFPALRMFNSALAIEMERQIRLSGRSFNGTLTKMPNINFEEVDKLDLEKDLKEKLISKLNDYLKRMEKSKK